MDDTDKLIKVINNYLPKLGIKRLRVILLLIHEFLKTSTVR